MRVALRPIAEDRDRLAVEMGEVRVVVVVDAVVAHARDSSAHRGRHGRGLASEDRDWQGRSERGVLAEYASEWGRSQGKIRSRQTRLCLRRGALTRRDAS